MKPYKITGNGVLYRVKTAAQVNQKLVEAAEWPADKKLLCFDFASMKLNQAQPPKFEVSSRYSRRIACYSPGRGLKDPGRPVPAAGITVRAPRSLAELRRVSKKHFFKYWQIWGDRVGADFTKDWPEYSKDYLPKVKALIVERAGRDVGLYTHTPLKGVAGKLMDHMCWHSLLPGLSKAERASAHYQAALWLKQTTKLKIGVVFSLVDRDSYEFFSGMGFTTCRLVLGRRRK